MTNKSSKYTIVMMKNKGENKMKNNKGITLVALIITIIVLIIIATVTIRQVTNKDIVSEAQNTRMQYLSVQDQEEGEIQDTANFIKEIKEQAKADEEDGSEVVLEPKTTYQFTVENDRSYEVNAGTTWEQFANSSNGVFVTPNRTVQHSTLGTVMLGNHVISKEEAIQDGGVYHCRSESSTSNPEDEMITFYVGGNSYQVVAGTTWAEFASTNNNFEVHSNSDPDGNFQFIVYQKQFRVCKPLPTGTGYIIDIASEQIVRDMTYVLQKETTGEFSDI